MAEPQPITLVTISASYGAGGSQVGPAVAERLDVPFVDRAVSAAIADKLGITQTAAEKLDDDVERGLDRILAHLAPVGEFYGDIDPELLQRSTHHEAAEQVIREIAATRRAVILGRAGAIVLEDDPRALHVRLDGPPERRIAQAMALSGVDAETAQRRLKKTDRAREAYVKRYYGRDARDCKLYDMVLDSTSLGLGACVELIVGACAAKGAETAPRDPSG